MMRKSLAQKLGRVLSIGAGFLAVGLVVGFAVARIFVPSVEVTASQSFSLSTVRQGSVGSSFTLGAVAEWQSAATASNHSSGIVTSIEVKPGTEISAPSPIYSVNARKTVLAKGAVPAYRDLTGGVSGADVRQLQTMLSGLGFYVGPVDGSGSLQLTGAIRAWQESIGSPVDGVVKFGDIIFTPELPARVALDMTKLFIGAQVAGGEPAILVLEKAPTFTLTVSQSQQQQIPDGVATTIQYKGRSWPGKIGGRSTDAQKNILLSVISTNSGPLCGQDCASIPVVGQVPIAAKIAVIPEQKGLTVPTAAIRTGIDGSTYVVTEQGEHQDVKVVISHKGISIVSGVAEGERVQVAPELGP